MSMAHEKVYECTEVGVFSPQMRPTKTLGLGSVGYVIANIKSLGDIDVGDTMTEASNPAHVALAGLSQSRRRWSTAVSIQTKAPSTATCATRSKR